MVRMIVPMLLIGVIVCLSHAQDEAKKKAPLRYGYDVDESTYPQKTPAEAMGSIVKALDRLKVDYLLAQMADPLYVDYWVDQYKKEISEGKEQGRRILAFERLARETANYYLNDPLLVRDLHVFAKEAKWEEKEDLAIGTVESIPARKVFLRKLGERWFIENKQQ
ncbi:MAG TPA: hypothetical protein VFE62_26490 [Gemmataceae bacterium]|nr:hypothetical protein [Gemmataceae bacterium]